MKTLAVAVMAVGVLGGAAPASAWTAPAHQLSGAIADRLLTDNARRHVQALLGYDLETAATWADCVRSVQKNADSTFSYVASGVDQTGCASFQSPAGLARMTDYAARNWDNCVFVPGRPCSASYHVTDVAYLHNDYSRAYFGTNFRDSVSAATAAILVLTGKPAPAPFSIKDQTEALLMVAHFAGDLHEPLAVATVYLDMDGRIVDPDAPSIHNPIATSTHASSLIRDGASTLRAEWEQIPQPPARPLARALIVQARAVPVMKGPAADWPVNWASDTVTASHEAFAGLIFQPNVDGYWSVIAPPDYAARREALQKVQIVKAGARLAQLLNALWP